MTIVPTAEAPPAATEGYAHALGALFYEFLSGTPPPAEPVGRRELPPLPVLNEEANAVLQHALSPQAGFRSEREFFEALLAACHLKRADLPPGADSLLPVPARTLEPPTGMAAHDPIVAALPMAPTIRTKLLRPPITGRNASSPATGSSWRAGRLVVILVVVLAVLAAGAAFLLRAAHRPAARPPLPAISP